MLKYEFIKIHETDLLHERIIHNLKHKTSLRLKCLFKALCFAENIW